MARIGLVLGAGGATGGAFHAGVLAALEAATGWDPRTADIVVGTSAGSMTGAMLRAGISAADIAARTEGAPLSPEGAARLRSAGLSTGEAPAPPRPRPRPAGCRGARRRRRCCGPPGPATLGGAALRRCSPACCPREGVPTTMISDRVRALLGDRLAGRGPFGWRPSASTTAAW